MPLIQILIAACARRYASKLLIYDLNAIDMFFLYTFIRINIKKMLLWACYYWLQRNFFFYARSPVGALLFNFFRFSLLS